MKIEIFSYNVAPLMTVYSSTQQYNGQTAVLFLVYIYKRWAIIRFVGIRKFGFVLRK
jgi:hypothetical protein